MWLRMRGNIGGMGVIDPSVLALKGDRGTGAWVNEDWDAQRLVIVVFGALV